MNYSKKRLSLLLALSVVACSVGMLSSNVPAQALFKKKSVSVSTEKSVSAENTDAENTNTGNTDTDKQPKPLKQAKKSKHKHQKTAKNLPPQKDFLPPVALINGVLDPKADPVKYSTTQDTASRAASETVSEQELETISLSAVAAPTLKTHAAIKKLDTDLGIRATDKDLQTMLALQRSQDEEDLKVLWEATVERNPVIRFCLEKLSTPDDLQGKKSSRFLNKTLNAMISGAALGSSLVPGGGAYRNMGSMAAGDLVRNIVNRDQMLPQNMLSPTEQIQLASLVDELQANLVSTYHNYKNTVQALVSAKESTQIQNKAYSQALQSGNPLAMMASASAYYKAKIQENALEGKAKLYRVSLERLTGSQPVNDLKLSIAIEADNNSSTSRPTFTATESVKAELAPKAAPEKTPEKTSPKAPEKVLEKPLDLLPKPAPDGLK